MTHDDEAHGLLVLLDRAHANLDAHPDRYRPRKHNTPAVRAYTYLDGDGRIEAIRRAGNGETYSAIARSMGLSHSTIRRAVLGISQGSHQ